MSDIMTVEQTADYLHLHPETLRAKARRGQIPAAKVGRQWRFSKVQLLAWIEQGAELPRELEDWALVQIAEERLTDPAREVRPWDEFVAGRDR
jgi:excisionase family DNA binding protein